MTLSPKFWGVAASGIALVLLAGYFFFWRPGQAPPIFTPIQEKTISDLEAANEKANKERESVIKAAQEAAFKATQAQTEAAKARTRLKELEAQMGQIEAKRGVLVTTPQEAIKIMITMGWLTK